MKTIRNKAKTTQYVAMEGGESLKTWHLLSLLGTGWEGQIFTEIIKQTAHAAWPSGLNNKGEQAFYLPTPEQVITRASAIVEGAVAEMKRCGWTVDMLPAEDLLEEGGKVGFTSSRDPVGDWKRSHGEADKGGEALPGAGHPAAADRRRG